MNRQTRTGMLLSMLLIFTLLVSACSANGANRIGEKHQEAVPRPK